MKITEVEHDRLLELADAGPGHRLTSDDCRLLRDFYYATDRQIQRDYTGRRIQIKEEQYPGVVMGVLDPKDGHTMRCDFRPEVYDWMATQLRAKSSRKITRILNGIGYVTVWFKTQEDAALFKTFWL